MMDLSCSFLVRREVPRDLLFSYLSQVARDRIAAWEAWETWEGSDGASPHVARPVAGAALLCSMPRGERAVRRRRPDASRDAREGPSQPFLALGALMVGIWALRPLPLPPPKQATRQSCVRLASDATVRRCHDPDA